MAVDLNGGLPHPEKPFARVDLSFEEAEDLANRILATIAEFRSGKGDSVGRGLLESDGVVLD